MSSQSSVYSLPGRPGRVAAPRALGRLLPVRFSTPLRVFLLAALLVTEISGVVALRRLGWFGTGSLVRWLACYAAAVLPLAVAAALLIRRRLRFNLRTLLGTMALVVLFFVVTGVPLRDAIEARRMSLKLSDAGVQLTVEHVSDDYLDMLGYARRSAPAPAQSRTELPPWLRPLADDLMRLPADDDVLGVSFEFDHQISTFCQNPAALRNLEAVSVWGRASADGMQQIIDSLPSTLRISEVSVGQVAVEPATLRALASVEFLHLESSWPYPRSAGFRGSARYKWRRYGSSGYADRLTDRHFAAIASLPQLKVLWIGGHDIIDADLAELGASKSLQHVVLFRTTASTTAIDRLRELLPNCKIRIEQ